MALDIVKAKAAIFRANLALEIRDTYAEDHGHEVTSEMLAAALGEAVTMLTRTLSALEAERSSLKI